MVLRCLVISVASVGTLDMSEHGVEDKGTTRTPVATRGHTKNICTAEPGRRHPHLRGPRRARTGADRKQGQLRQTLEPVLRNLRPKRLGLVPPRPPGTHA